MYHRRDCFDTFHPLGGTYLNYILVFVCIVKNIHCKKRKCPEEFCIYLALFI